LTFFRLLVIIQISDFKALLYSKFSSKILEPKRTPLYEIHRSLKAKFVDFAGWLMPVEYSGVIEEHLRVRTSCGLFDVSHMGEIEVAGKGALEAVQRISSNDAAVLKVGQAHYAGLLTPEGTFIDDMLVYRMAPSHFMLVVNAANTAKDFAWISEQAKVTGDAAVVDSSSRYAFRRASWVTGIAWKPSQFGWRHSSHTVANSSPTVFPIPRAIDSWRCRRPRRVLSAMY